MLQRRVMVRLNAWGGPRAVGRRKALALSGGVAGAALLAACGGGRKASTRVPTPVASPVTESQPRPGGVLRVRGSGTPPLDPHANASFLAQRLAGAVYSRLLRFKSGTDPAVSADYEVAPDLASAWEITEDGLQLTFRLHPNARWHDVAPVNGRAVESEDVRFALERFRSLPKNPSRAAFGSTTLPMIDRVETPDSHTFLVRLARPFGPILNLFANPQYLWVLPREAADGFDPAKTQIGSGPFVLEWVQPDALTRVRRNPEYFVQGRPYIDAFERVIIKEDAQERAQFQAERLDLAAVSPDAKPEIERSNPKARLLAYVPPTFTFLSPQLRGNSPYRDERVRRALSMSIDRKAWLDLMYPGTHGRCLSLVPASMGRWWLDPKSAEMGEPARWFRFDPRKARVLLQAAGAENLAVRFVYSKNAYGDRFSQGAEATIAMLREAGFTVQPVVQDYLHDFLAPAGTITGNYDGVFYGLQAAFSDPHDYLFSMNHTASRRNHAGVNDPEADRLIDLEAGTLDEQERVTRVKDVQRYLADRMYYIPLAVGETFVGIQPWVRNYRHSLNYGSATESYSELWLDR
jgi:peptide/nickel transport system substrate-binding protein